jgi:hypothetical protein
MGLEHKLDKHDPRQKATIKKFQLFFVNSKNSGQRSKGSRIITGESPSITLAPTEGETATG